MRNCIRAAVVCLLGCAGIATAQNFQPAARATSIETNAAIAERLAISERDRVQWEAGQTWLAPATPLREQVRPHTIHIDLAQPLTLPKLRREWLQPSAEAWEEKAEASTLITPKRSK